MVQSAPAASGGPAPRGRAPTDRRNPQQRSARTLTASAAAHSPREGAGRAPAPRAATASRSPSEIRGAAASRRWPASHVRQHPVDPERGEARSPKAVDQQPASWNAKKGKSGDRAVQDGREGVMLPSAKTSPTRTSATPHQAARRRRRESRASLARRRRRPRTPRTRRTG